MTGTRATVAAWGLSGRREQRGIPWRRHGANGAFEVQAITEDDWNAAFTQPYLLRLEPSSGRAGQQIHVVGKNFTSQTKLVFDGNARDAQQHRCGARARWSSRCPWRERWRANRVAAGADSGESQAAGS